jgi:hypothetical protein
MCRFVAAVVNDTEAHGDFEIVGQSVTYVEIAHIYEKVKGKPIEIHNIGNIDDLVLARDSAKSKGNMPAYIWYAYTVPIVDGRGKLHNPKHQQYGIVPTSVE